MSTDDSPRQAVAYSFIHVARREQMVNSAIEVIAELGYENASVVKIARRAGVSRGVVNYHFRDADDLTDAVVAEVYRIGGERLRGRVAAAPGPRASLLEFVRGSVEFYADHPRHLAALHEIFVARRRSPDHSRHASPLHASELDDLAALLRAGRDAGEFRDLDVTVIADVVRAVLDTALPRILAGHDDIPALRDELVAAGDALTRAP